MSLVNVGGFAAPRHGRTDASAPRAAAAAIAARPRMGDRWRTGSNGSSTVAPNRPPALWNSSGVAHVSAVTEWAYVRTPRRTQRGAGHRNRARTAARNVRA